MNILPHFLRKRIAHRPNLLKIVDNIGWLSLGRALRIGGGLFVGVWLARYLGPEQFGLLYFCIAFVGLFGAIQGLGLEGIVVRDIVRDPMSKEETLGTAAVLQLIGGVFAYGLVLGAIFWLRPEDTLAKILVAILGSMLLFKASDVAVFWFESQVQSKYTVWAQSSTYLLFCVIKATLILYHAPLIAFAWAAMAEAVVGGLLLLVMLGLGGPSVRRLYATVDRTKTLLKNSWPLFLSGIAVVIYMRIDQIMLGQLVGDQAVGIYSAAIRISEAWYFIPVMSVASVFPAILEAQKRSETQYYQRLQYLFDLMVFMSVGIALPMTFLSTPIVILLFGENYAESGLVLAIHIWAAVFVFLGVASGRWFLAENRQIQSFQRTAFGAVLNVMLNLLLIPDLGSVGAALATVISYGASEFFIDAIQRETRTLFFMKIKALNLPGAVIRLRSKQG